MTHQKLFADLQDIAHSLDKVAFARLMKNAHFSDIADVMNKMHPDTVLAMLTLLDPLPCARLFTHFTHQRQDALLNIMPRKAVAELFDQLPSDERADLYNRLKEDVRQRLLPAMAQVEREDILRMASYPEGSTGAETTSDYVSVSPDMTVTQALTHIRATAPDKETIYVVYVLDDAFRLRGTVSLRELVLAEENNSIESIMRPDPISASAHWPRERASGLIHHYDLLALPVINNDDKMIGIVTVDDAMDIEKERDASQLARFGGTALNNNIDLDMLTSSFGRMFKVRVFWLIVLTLFGITTSTFVAAQEELLTEVIVLAAFIAPIVDMGGNTGSQSATLVIRAMALGELRLNWRDVWFVIRRELPIAAALGLVIAVLEIILAYFAKGVGLNVLMVVGLSMLVCTALGGIIGAILPFIARRIGTDPATLSSPLITSIMDLIGVFIYFGFAYLFLADLLTQAG